MASLESSRFDLYDPRRVSHTKYPVQDSATGIIEYFISAIEDDNEYR